jgi:hypothetical protein
MGRLFGQFEKWLDIVQLEITEIHGTATQGWTVPLHCKLSNRKNHYAKGKRATAAGLIKEWMAANLAKALNLPIPNFCIAYADKRLIDIFDKDFGHGEVFASECIEFANEFDYQSPIDTNLQRDILLFDLWIENEDRTLNEAHSGNPNLLWARNQLYIIDHNLAFEDDFNQADFWQTHVFREWQFEINERSQFEQRLQNALLDWQQWWADVPESWKEANHNFDEQRTLKRLTEEAHGNIWLKL